MSSAPPLAPSKESEHPQRASIADRVVLLINYVMKHQEPQFRELAKLVPDLRLLLSVLVEPQRDYKPQLSELNVIIQKNLTVSKKWNHESGFEDNLNLQLPYDTFFQLYRLRPKVVVSYELGLRSILGAMYRTVFRRSRLVLAVYVSEHTERSWSRGRTFLRKRLLKRADVVTYQGSSCKRYLLSLGVPECRLKHNPYTAHPDMLYRGSTHREPAPRRKLLCVGQLTQRKAPDKLLGTLSRWCQDHPHQSVEINFVGRGPLQQELESARYPDNLKVRFLGSVAPQTMPEVMSQHGIMVFPTLADEWGLVVDEALHSGLPVFASEYAQATLDLIREGENGWRFQPDDQESMYAAIDRMLNCDDDTLNTMAANGRSSVAHRTPEYSGRCLADAIDAARQS
jgi:glycosyltransferase involved in cell wall biosynthesis